MPAPPNATTIPLLNLHGDPDQLHESIDSGFLLPTRWYSDPAIFQSELSRIHRRAWHFATHTDDLKAPGDVYVRNIAGVPIVLVRDADLQIRGFITSAGIAATRLSWRRATNPSCVVLFTHGPTASTASCRHAPRSAGDPTFDPAEFSLVAIQTQVWGPMIWANLDLTAPSFDEWISGMPQLLAERGLNVDEHTFGFDNTWEIDSNWKVFQDNTIECYHCPTTHPELARVLEMRPDHAEIRVGGRYWIDHSIPFRSNFEGSLTTKKTEGVPFNYYYHWVFPTTYLQYAGRGFDIGSLDIVAVDKIRFRHICFMPRGTPPERLARGKEQLDADATIQQDVGLCNRVQAGHAAGWAPTNRVLREPEFLLSHFHHLIVDMMCR